MLSQTKLRLNLALFFYPIYSGSVRKGGWPKAEEAIVGPVDRLLVAASVACSYPAFLGIKLAFSGSVLSFFSSCSRLSGLKAAQL